MAYSASVPVVVNWIPGTANKDKLQWYHKRQRKSSSISEKVISKCFYFTVNWVSSILLSDTQSLPAAHAVLTATTCWMQPSNAHSIAHFGKCYTRSYRYNLTCTFMSRTKGQHALHWPISINSMNICVTTTTSANANQNLTGNWEWDYNFPYLEQASMLCCDGSLHPQGNAGEGAADYAGSCTERR